jgi:hypothetical protein
MRMTAVVVLAFVAAAAACIPTLEDRQANPKAARKRTGSSAAGPSGLRQKPRAPVEVADFPKPAPLDASAHSAKSGNEYADRFMALWNDMHAAKNGYFSPEGVPYHAVETLLVEAPDYGHETTSEAFSYWMWLEAAYGKLSKDWKPLAKAWEMTEAYLIPTPEDQPTAGSYTETHPAVFAGEQDQPSGYPVPLDSTAPTGKDPLFRELKETYHTPFVYGMHWIIDVDNWYGFGRRGDRVSRPAYINTFQRGEEESVWEAIAQPCWEDFQFGGNNGYLDLFVKQDGGYVRQWKYTTAPDADARVVQAMYWAKQWSDEQGAGATIEPLVKNTARLGDYLRYALFDKYFKTQGCQTPQCPAAEGYDGAHWLLAWYYAWGGSLSKVGGWSWRIGASTAHSGYQNPFAAWVLANAKAFKPLSKNGARDWGKSLDRQLELYRWLQSAEGGIAGGATNSWKGRYDKFPANLPTFYQLGYVEAPVYVDPPSNNWFGFQAWSLDRVAQLYYVTGNDHAQVVLDRWVKWVLANVRLGKDGGFEIPSDLAWSGAPQLNWDDKTQNWNAKDAGFNKTLHVKVKTWGQDLGVAGALARTLLFYAAKSGDHAAARLAKELLDRMWKKFRDDKGVAGPETRVDFKRFGDQVFIPAGWQGEMPNGDPMNAESTFASLRTRYRKDPEWPKIEATLHGGPAPTFTYHRFWAQADIALANATMAMLYPEGIKAPAAAAAPAAASKAKGKSAAKAKAKGKKK